MGENNSNNLFLPSPKVTKFISKFREATRDFLGFSLFFFYFFQVLLFIFLPSSSLILKGTTYNSQMVLDRPLGSSNVRFCLPRLAANVSFVIQGR